MTSLDQSFESCNGVWLPISLISLLQLKVLPLYVMYSSLSAALCNALFASIETSGTDVTILAIAVRDIRATERRLIKTIKMC